MTVQSDRPQNAIAGGATIRVQPQPTCYLCGRRGVPLYAGLTDRLFAAPGSWSLKRCPAQGCQLIWLDPMPAEEDLAQTYTSYYTHSSSGPPRNRARQLHAAVSRSHIRTALGYGVRAGASRWDWFFSLVAHLHPGGAAELGRPILYLAAREPGALVIDVGAGGGELLSFLRKLGWSTEGVDVDPQAVARATAAGLAVHLGDLAAQRYPDDCADAICIAHVLEHVHDPLALLRECYRVLKPGGRLVLVTPNAAALGHRLFGDAWVALDPPRHLRIFRVATLGQITRQSGFSILRLTSTVQGARTIWTQGWRIRRAGRWDVGRGLPSVASHLAGIPFQLIERALISLGLPVGEESLLVATKT